MIDTTLYHFSEDPSITVFKPRNYVTFNKPLVWAIDKKRAQHYYFPRDCPRIGFWINHQTTQSDKEKFFNCSTTDRIIAIESAWLEQIKKITLYIYHLPAETFTCVDENAGYYASYSTVTPLAVEKKENLLDSLLKTNNELRMMPSLWRLYEQIIQSSVGYSIIRMRNASKYIK